VRRSSVTAPRRRASTRARQAGPPGEPRAINPPALGQPRGFTHGWVAPPGARLLFVAGQTAADAAGRTATSDFAAQFDAALARVLDVVLAAGGRREHVVRMTVYVTDMRAYVQARPAVGAAWQARMGRHYPAMALVEVTRLVDEGVVVEIEATAALPPSSR
jgi:enamine deaminase RidA (YjgF/YER057c/UK114 family)